MTEWKRVCCAVDFSESSRIAMLKAAELARRFEEEVALLHVVLPPVVGDEMIVTPEELGRAQRAEVEKKLALWREEAEQVSRRPVRSVVLEGDPATEIVRFAREWRCDILVVGTHGRRGFSRLVLGSVAEKVVRAAPCTVLVVRRPEPSALQMVERDESGGEVVEMRRRP